MESDIWKDGIKLSTKENQVLIHCIKKQINIYKINGENIINIVGQFTQLLKETIKEKYPGNVNYFDFLIIFQD